MANDAAGVGQNAPAVASYLDAVFGPEDAVLAEIRQRSSREGLPEIAVARLDGRHLTALALAAGAKKIVEIGTLAGYSGVCLARALPGGGRLDTFEFDAKHAKVAVESFRRAGVEKLVHVHVGPASENLPSIEKNGPFDLVFIDADKLGYPDYLRWATANLRRGGLVLADNVFRAAFGPNANWGAESIEALDLFNRELANGGAFVATFLPTVEGLAMGVKI
ncbi:MAG: O-methyltransferase [Thermoanaerobaculia bacterium]